MTANKKLDSELLIVRNANQNLQNRIVNFEKQQSKLEKYNRHNNVEISGRNRNQNLEETVIRICRDSGIGVNALDIEGCHRLILERNATNTIKHVPVKFVNRKQHSEAMLQHKKDLNKKSKALLAICCVPVISFCGESA